FEIWVARLTRSADISGRTENGSPPDWSLRPIHFCTAQVVLRMWSTELRNSDRTRGSRLPDFTSSSSSCNSLAAASRRAVIDGAGVVFSDSNALIRYSLRGRPDQ